MSRSFETRLKRLESSVPDLTKPCPFCGRSGPIGEPPNPDDYPKLHLRSLCRCGRWRVRIFVNVETGEPFPDEKKPEVGPDDPHPNRYPGL